MTLDTELVFPFQDQVVGIIGSHGAVTGDTGDHPAGPRVRYLGTDRMGELALVFVTPCADLQAVALEQGHIVPAV